MEANQNRIVRKCSANRKRICLLPICCGFAVILLFSIAGRIGNDILFPIFPNSRIHPARETPTVNISNEQKATTAAPVKHVAYLKVHKTGSSSVQNIFIRFGDTRHLTFLLAATNPNNECGGWSNCISFYNTLTERNIVPPPTNKSYELLCSHVIYNKEAFQKYLPSDTRYIGLVREPVKRLASAIAFHDVFKNVSISLIASNMTGYSNPWSNNRMAFEYGFKTEWFPTASHTMLSETERVDVIEYLDQIMDDFHLILVNERLDESLVLMRRMLGWTIPDILYQRKMVKHHPDFQEKDIPNIKHFLYLDYILYERAVKILDAKIAQAGSDFQDEVNFFKDVNKAVDTLCRCRNCRTDKSPINTAPWGQPFYVTPSLCNNLRKDEVQYLNQIRIKQYGGR